MPDERLCVPSMGIWYRRYQIIPDGVSPLCAGVPAIRRDRLCPEALASRKACPALLSGGGGSDPTSEGSETAKPGSNEQELNTRLVRPDEVAHHADVQRIPKLNQ